MFSMEMEMECIDKKYKVQISSTIQKSLLHTKVHNGELFTMIIKLLHVHCTIGIYT